MNERVHTREQPQFAVVDVQHLAAQTMSIPGEGARMLMCLSATYHDAGADGITIVAMADSLEVLAERVAQSHLYTRTCVDTYKYETQSVVIPSQQYAYGDAETGEPPRHDDGGYTEEMIVLDIPPASIKALNLESIADLRTNIQAMQEAAENTAGAPGM